MELTSECDIYVKREGFDTATELIKISKVLIITGCHGSGKSTLARALLRHFDNYTPRIVFSSREWLEFISPDQNQIVLVDDLLGRAEFEVKDFTHWSSIFDSIESFTRQSRSLAIITVSSEVKVQTVRSKVDTILSRFSSLDLDTYLLSDAKKSEMLIKHMTFHGDLISDKQLQEILKGDVSGARFPICCREYAESSSSQEDRKSIFTKHLTAQRRISSILRRRCLYRINDGMGNTELHCACFSEQLLLVKVLIDRGESVEARNKFGETPLKVACNQGNISIAMLLLGIEGPIRSQYEDVFTRDPETILQEAVRKGDIAIARHLLCQGADPQVKGENGRTLLHLAVEAKHIQMVEFLLHDVSDINAADKDGQTALHYASNLSQATLNIDKTTPLHLSCEAGHIEIVTSLLAANSCVNARDIEGRTPLYTACLRGHCDVVNCLLTCDSDVNLADSKGKSPLHVACAKGFKNIVARLLEENAIVDAADIAGNTPLHSSCFYGNCTIVPQLLQSGSKCNTRNLKKQTPLHVACDKGFAEVVKYLLDYGSDVNMQDEAGWTPLYVACNHGYVEIVKMLLHSNAKISIVCTSKERFNAFHVAVSKGHTDIVRLLLEYYDVANSAYGNTGHAPLHKACQKGCEQIVGLLIRHGARVNVRSDKEKATPLHLACERGHTAIVKRLLEAKANVNAMDTEGRTPVYLACLLGHYETVMVLRMYAANINIPDKAGKSPLHVANEKHFDDIVTLLLEIRKN